MEHPKYLTPKRVEMKYKEWISKRYVLDTVYAKIPKYREKATELSWYITEAYIGSPTTKPNSKKDKEINRLVKEWIKAVNQCVKKKRVPFGIYGKTKVAVLIRFKGKTFILWPEYRPLFGSWGILIEEFQHLWQLSDVDVVIKCWGSPKSKKKR